jgi:hypothetical protein
MSTRTQFWLKVGVTFLFIAVEIFTFPHSVMTAFRQPSVSATTIALGSQLSFVLGLSGLWYGGRARVAEDAGWGSLVLFTLIVTLS